MKLYGLDTQIAAFRAAISGERMHHAWLLAGPRGVGKGSFARAAAHAILSGAPYDFQLSQDHPTSRYIAAHSHPDYKLVEREIWMKGESFYQHSAPSGANAKQPLFSIKGGVETIPQRRQ